ncbi:hypothetical protein EBO15_19200 [Actinomadura harenae]|uniref:Uncharacterized protein n=2 Tax=Actinomadura harenae TaxID=2483351 RepID=A0A3M2LZ49_9ACTN|nr:hypothetical protein EBO15_19200 [Actinomadura harenae]
MGAAVTSLIAVAGTLLGSLATYSFQRRISQQTERFALERQLREQQVSVLSEFARAVADYRGGQTDLWHRANESAGSAAHEEARLRSHRLRAVVNQELFRLKILVSDSVLTQAAEGALVSIWTLHDHEDRQSFEEGRLKSSHTIDEYVRLANRYVQATFAVGGPTGRTGP